MLQSLRGNRELLKRPTSFTRPGERKYFEGDIDPTSLGAPMKFKQPSPRELEAFMRGHRERMLIHRRKKILALLISSLLVVSAFISIEYAGGRRVEKSEKVVYPIHESYYTSYVNLSARALQQGDERAAEDFLLLAHKCAPESWDAQWRLLQIYLMQCERDGLRCYEASKVAQKLIDEHGERSEFQEALQKAQRCYLQLKS